MTFEEFFKKKKISLQLLQEAEPALFLEFEAHYRQMGERSFDHTKKYWFNQLRHKFPAPPEVKPEKVIIENPIAEQTVADTLTEPAAPASNVGFRPRFNSGMAKKPSLDQAASTEPKAEEKSATGEAPNPSLGFKPKFRAASPSKPAEENTEIKPDAPSEEPKASPALGFKPKFKAASTPKRVEEHTEPNTDAPNDQSAPAPALGFKPKFRAAVAPKPVDDVEPEIKKDELVNKPPAESAPKPVGFKPRFNAKNIKPKEGEE
jgi:hypothetical protein